MLLLILVQWIPGLSQTKVVTFDKKDLVEVLEQIQRSSKISFNYASEIVEGQHVSGAFSYEDPLQSLTVLLRPTQLECRQEGDRILILASTLQDYQICGTITSLQTGEPLSLANVHMPGLNLGTESDEAGFFSIDVQGYKNEIVTISYLGYFSEHKLIGEWTSSDCININLGLNVDLFGGEILIRDYLLTGIDAGGAYGSNRVNLDQLGKSFPTARGDVLRTLQLLPGVTALDGSASNLNIRGSTPDQNLLVWEGVTLYDPGHLFGMVSSINPFLIERVDVYKTVFEPTFANRIGGVMDLSMSDDMADGLSGGLGMTLTEVHGDLKFPILQDRITLTIAARQSLSSLNTPTLSSFADKVFQDVRIDGDSGSDEVRRADAQEITYHDVTSKFMYDINDRWQVSAAFTTNDNRFEDESEFEDEQVETTERIATSATAFSTILRRTARKFQTSLQYAYSSYSMSQASEFGDSEEDLSFESTLADNTILDRKISLNNKLTHSNWQLGFGYEWEYKEAQFELEEQTEYSGTQSDSDFSSAHFHNLFGSASWMSCDFNIRFGLRGTYYNQVARFFMSPRFSAQYSLHDSKVRLRLSAGRFHQFISQLQNVDELNLLHNVWMLSDVGDGEDGLRSDKLSLGLAYQEKDFLLDIEGYLQTVRGINSLSAVSISGELESALGESQTHGLDLLVRKDLGPHQIWLNYSLSKNRYQFSQFDKDWFPADNDHRHHLSAAGMVSWKSWTGTLSYHMRSGLPYTPVNGLTLSGEDDYSISYGQINSLRLKPFTQLDLTLTYQSGALMWGTRLEVSLSVFNLAGRTNPYTRRNVIAEIDDDVQPDLLSFEKNHIGRTPQALIRVFF